ncbi:RNA-directed DNA polymerase, putative transposable element encoded protein [Trachipleistophora hominis]|uniref:RNA-directed DNA polymerase, putative transposable element encoded protein n=1 Tax=Trachipleistophora hominis TaxID=72359 RepID=L7JWM6_TRAHO|nr:RNA-directed DNA polymerase, putative transposable element encoded protein [Trachipleistophora hominis]
MQKISDWCKRWRMSLNIGKCGTMVFSSGEVCKICYKEQPIATVDSYKYFGLPLMPDLDLNVVVRDRKEKAIREYHGMRPFLT